MKSIIDIAIVCLASLSIQSPAWTLLVEGTNRVEVVFEDPSLSPSDRELIEADMRRLFAPSISNATIEAEREKVCSWPGSG